VKVHNDIMVELSGCEAKELEEMRKQLKTKPQNKTELCDVSRKIYFFLESFIHLKGILLVFNRSWRHSRIN
jgi:hypothetical protein